MPVLTVCCIWGRRELHPEVCRGLQEKVESVDGTVILNWEVNEWMGGYGKVSLAQEMDK
jgi:hypothetical protein